MQTIQSPSGNTMKILGKPKASEDGFRWMTYVLPLRVEGGTLVFHTLTREMLLLTPEEYADPDAVPELREKWFRVPQKLDDRKYADQVRFVRKTVRKKPEHITKYTVFTTTDCNARCFYCYEMGRSRIPMTEETAHKAAAYIANHCGGKPVMLSWFGGEPLYNRQVIDIICNDLAEKGIRYQSSITSNGYLFNEELVRKAVNLWKVYIAQITLDGTESVYNRTKAFIYRDGESPYHIVMENIGRLLDAQIRVQIRLNIDLHNAEDLMKLVEELHQRFSEKENLVVYSHVLFESLGSKPHTRSQEERRELYEKQQRLRERIAAFGFNRRRDVSQNPHLNYCMADSDKALTILPDGSLGLCEHYSEDNFVGHIDREGLDEQMVRSFHECWEPIEDCSGCFFYPECIRLKKCVESEMCFPEIQEEHRQDTFDGMERTYAAWRSKEELEEDDQPGLC